MVQSTCQFSVAEIIKITCGTWFGQDGDRMCRGISPDTRLLRPGELFIALKGKQFDGNDFFREALERGAAAVLISRMPTEEIISDIGPAEIIVVPDTVVAMQQLAIAWRRRVKSLAIGITGSTGKTIVKDMLYAILSRSGSVSATPMSFHGQIGLPLSIFNIPEQSSVAILELGISRPGEMERLSAIAQIDIGILTNISEAHLEHLGDLDNVACEKAKMFEGLTTERHLAILNADDEHCRLIRQRLRCPSQTFGLSTDAEFRADDIVTAGRKGSWCTVHCPDSEFRLFINAPGRHNIYNALAAIAAARHLGASIDTIREGLEHVHLPQMRLEIHTSSVLEENVTIINDTYNASPASMKGALEALREMAGQKRAIAVLGDMLELGNFSWTAHEIIGHDVVRQGIDILMTIGTLARVIGSAALSAGMPAERIFTCEDMVEAAEILRTIILEDDFILFKGSRMLQLDLLAAQFVGGIRPTKLIIDLEAIAHNIFQIKNRIGPDIAIMAVVKSGGYGHDSRKIARVVLEAGADYLAVAVPDEGIFLRKAGFTDTPILVMGPTLPEEAAKLVKYRLAQVVFNRQVLLALEAEAKKRRVTVPVHLKVDTGMGRIGLQVHELPAFIEFMANLRHIMIEGIMSHLSSADDPTADEFTRRQIATFADIVNMTAEQGLSVKYKHLASSAGIMRFPEAWFSMVRPGIMMYGLCPSPGMKHLLDLRPAARFVTKVAHVKTVPQGTPISYSRSFFTERETRVATIPVGYYDGYNRLLSNKAHVLIRGRRAPVIGNVTMDMTMVDVTSIDGVSPGDDVVLFGPQNGEKIEIDELAAICHTINYELIGNISARVSRVYEDA